MFQIWFYYGNFKKFRLLSKKETHYLLFTFSVGAENFIKEKHETINPENWNAKRQTGTQIQRNTKKSK